MVQTLLNNNLRKKIMKKLFITLVFFAVAITNSSAQATLLIDNVAGNQGSSISVPVNAIGLTDMQGFQFTIDYDNTKLTYVNCTNWSGGTNASGVQITDLPTLGKITFVYNDVSIKISSGLFFNLNFSVQPLASGSAAVAWSDLPTNRELSNSIPDIIVADYKGGFITINTLGTEENNFLDYIYYPNPTTGKVTMNSKEPIVEVAVYNLQGQLLYIQKPNELSTNVDMSKFASATYLIKVKIEGRETNFKILKM